MPGCESVAVFLELFAISLFWLTNGLEPVCQLFVF